MPLTVDHSNKVQAEVKPESGKGNPGGISGRLANIPNNFRNYKHDDQESLKEVFTNNFAPFMLSQLSQDQLAIIAQLAAKALHPELLGQLNRDLTKEAAAVRPGEVVVTRPEPIKYFDIPLTEGDFREHEQNIRRLGDTLAEIISILKTNIRETGSNTSLAGTALADTMIATGGANAVKCYKLEFNRALKVLNEIVQRAKLVSDEIVKLDGFSGSVLKLISTEKQQLVSTSAELAEQQHNLHNPPQKKSATTIASSVMSGLTSTVSALFAEKEVDPFPVIETSKTTVESMKFSSERFTQYLEFVQSLLNKVRSTILVDSIVQAGLSTAPRHILEVVPVYKEDDFMAIKFKQSDEAYKRTLELLQGDYVSLSNAELNIQNLNAQLQKELVNFKTTYEKQAEGLIAQFNIYRTAVTTLCKNMGSEEEIQALTPDAKVYEVK